MWLSGRSNHSNLVRRQFQKMNQKKSKGQSKRQRREILKQEASENEDFNPLLFQKFKRYLCKRRVAFLRERLADYYGKNFVIDYQDRFNFEEEWEDKVTISNKVVEDNGLEENLLEIGSSVIIAFILAVGVWVSTVDLIFRYPSQLQRIKTDRQIYTTVYSITLCIIILDMTLKIRKKIFNNTFQCSLKSIMQLMYRQLICLLSLSLKLSSGEDINHTSSGSWLVFELIVIIMMYLRASKLYMSIRLISYSLYYEYHSKICDLIITLFIILNFIAILLFLVTFLGFEKTWLSELGIDQTKQFIVYIYSFYYASTTILTVGYGDLSPKNPAEVVLIVIIQIVGIATLGFIISEIGYCISYLRKGRETMQKDLSIILKMRKHYKMNEKLLKEARSFIINNQQKVDQLYPNEEKYLLSKFNEELRNNISKENLSSVIKSSIFFITRWSINFQRSISNKLEYILFSPNDLLYQPKNKERVYIVKNGKINVYAEKNGRKKGQKNLLKSIDNNEVKEISDNSYGYTAVISTRPSRLYAIAKTLTSAYYIDRENFIHCLSQRFSDYEYYHEIKSKMDQQNHWQAFEAPLIQSSKNHFNPTKQQIIRKYMKRHFEEENKRGQQKRSLRKSNMIVVLDEQQTISIRSKVNRLETKYTHSYPSLTRLESVSKSSQILKTILEQNLEKEIQDNYSTYIIKQLVGGHDLKDNFDHYFDIGKQYNNYFPRRNPSFVLRKLELEYVLPNANEKQQAELKNAVYKASWQ